MSEAATMGRIRASCGHWLEPDEDGEAVAYGDYSCDAVDGWRRAVVHALVCNACADDLRKEGGLFTTEEQEDEWLDGEDDLGPLDAG